MKSWRSKLGGLSICLCKFAEVFPVIGSLYLRWMETGLSLLISIHKLEFYIIYIFHIIFPHFRENEESGGNFLINFIYAFVGEPLNTGKVYSV